MRGFAHRNVDALWRVHGICSYGGIDEENAAEPEPQPLWKFSLVRSTKEMYKALAGGFVNYYTHLSQLTLFLALCQRKSENHVNLFRSLSTSTVYVHFYKFSTINSIVREYKIIVYLFYSVLYFMYKYSVEVRSRVEEKLENFNEYCTISITY